MCPRKPEVFTVWLLEERFADTCLRPSFPGTSVEDGAVGRDTEICKVDVVYLSLAAF